MKTLKMFYANCYDSVFYSIKLVGLTLLAIPLIASAITTIAKYIPLIGTLLVKAFGFIGQASTVIGSVMLVLAGSATIARIMSKE